MSSEALAVAIEQSQRRNLSVLDLIRTADGLKPSVGMAGVMALYHAWISHNQDNPLLYAVLFNHSVLLADAGEQAAARACLEQCLELNPDFTSAYINLGRVYERQGDAAAAVLQWQALTEKLAGVTGSAIAHKVTALNQTARVLEENQQDEPAENMLRQSLDLDRDQPEAAQHYLALRQRQCKWPVVEPWERMSRAALVKGMSPLSMGAYADDPMLHLAAAAHYNQRDVGLPGDGLITAHWAAREARRPERLRIGYLSSDMRDHAVGYLTAEIFGLHDREQVEVFVYYCGTLFGGGLQERIKNDADHWVPIAHLDDAAAARRIADDGVHILIDLNGYTRDGRTKLIALRPAPIIVNWLGYPGTTASPYHHYLIADDWIIPPENEVYYSEKVLRLPCYQPNDRRRAVAAERPSRQDVGLPDDALVYCCFNGLHKINRFTFARWTTILQRVPHAVLWLLSGAESAQANLRAAAAAAGVDPARLIFADKRANPHHLARYPLADLFLDTFPYGAHTTASDALWMGVPMLTMSGASFASRVCGSLIRSAGLPELVCASPEEYVGRAVALGRDRAALQRHRDRLAEARENCALFDTPRLVGALEDLYRRMWTDLEEGRLPQPDLRNLDVYLEIGAEFDHDAAEFADADARRAWWAARLRRRHMVRPIPADDRLAALGGAEG